jgi:hypothetical protein
MSNADARKLIEVAHRDAACAGLLAKAARAERASPDVSDWLITIQFYALCLHVQALALCKGLHITRHEELRSWINENPDTRGMARDYRLVETRSREARYDGRLYGRPEVEEFNRRFTSAMTLLLPLLRKEGIDSEIIEPLPRKRITTESTSLPASSRAACAGG